MLEAHLAGLDVIIKEGMANGRVLAGGKAGVLAEAAGRHNVQPDALALALIMRQPFVPMVLSGAATVEHLRCGRACVCV